MEFVRKLGNRWYVFCSKTSADKATEMHIEHGGDQNGFEDRMEDEGIEFNYEIPDDL